MSNRRQCRTCGRIRIDPDPRPECFECRKMKATLALLGAFLAAFMALAAIGFTAMVIQ